MMIATLMLSATSADLSAAEQQRIGVYVLAGLVGLLVTGLTSWTKASRRRKAASLNDDGAGSRPAPHAPGL